MKARTLKPKAPEPVTLPAAVLNLNAQLVEGDEAQPVELPGAAWADLVRLASSASGPLWGVDAAGGYKKQLESLEALRDDLATILGCGEDHDRIYAAVLDLTRLERFKLDLEHVLKVPTPSEPADLLADLRGRLDALAVLQCERLDAALRAPPPEKFEPAGKFDFANHLRRQRDFSLRTFGPGDAADRFAGLKDHIEKELRELARAPNDLEEWIDVVILALDGAWRTGASPEAIHTALEAKQRKNESRTWPDWRTAAPGKAIEHVKEAPCCGSINTTFTDGGDCQACGAYVAERDTRPIPPPRKKRAKKTPEKPAQIGGEP